MKKCILIAIILGMMTISAGTASFAVTINVPLGGSIQNALNIANSGDVVKLSSGTYTQRNIIWPHLSNVTLSGEGSTNTIISLEALGRAITVEGAYILNINCLTIRDGLNSGVGGGAIYLSPSSTLNIKDVRFFTNNGWEGGAIYAVNANINAQDCLFKFNRAGANYGVAYGGTWNITRCNFSDNAATTYGGVSGGGTWYANDCEFSNNTNGWNAGVAQGGTWNVTNCRFINNHVPQSGGVANGSTWTATGCAFSSNNAADTGGVFASSNVNVYDCTFESNSAGNLGGVFSRSTARATNCAFSSNSANRGGVAGWTGLWPSPGYIFDTYNCMFNLNQAASIGAVAWDIKFISKNSVFKSNSAPTGGVFAVRALDVTGCTFESNSASYRGGVGFGGDIEAGMTTYIYPGIISNCTFISNSSGNSYGGGVANSCSWEVTNSIFSQNNSYYGGCFSNSKNVKLKNCTFYNIDGRSGAFGRTAYNTTLTATNCVFWGTSQFDSCSGTMRYCDAQAGILSPFTNVGCISGDPLFADPENWDFQLVYNYSPCVDSGTSEGAPANDIKGTHRPYGPGFDIGAYELIYQLQEAPTIEAIYINGVKAITGEIVSPIMNVRVHLMDLLGIATLEVTPDSPPLPVAFTLTEGTTNDGYWEGILSMESTSVSLRSITFYATNSKGYFTQLVMPVRIIRGSVQVVGPLLNYPNPFKPLSSNPNENSTMINYTLNVDAPITLVIYDNTGHEVMKKVFTPGGNGGRAGINTVGWNGRNLFGEVGGNGMYVYKIISRNKVIGSGKLVILDK